MTSDKANKVYDILVEKGGASNHMRDAFVSYYTIEDTTCWDEWRFSGKLGYGGKYRGNKNKIDCYVEDETPETLALIYEINKLLKAI